MYCVFYRAECFSQFINKKMKVCWIHYIFHWFDLKIGCNLWWCDIIWSEPPPPPLAGQYGIKKQMWWARYLWAYSFLFLALSVTTSLSVYLHHQNHSGFCVLFISNVFFSRPFSLRFSLCILDLEPTHLISSIFLSAVHNNIEQCPLPTLSLLCVHQSPDLHSDIQTNRFWHNLLPAPKPWLRKSNSKFSYSNQPFLT